VQVVDNRALLFRTRTPGKYSVIPKSKVLGEVAPGIHEVLVHWGLDEARVLKNLGVRNVPSPIERRYGWPGRYTPFAHQRDTASFLTLNRRGFCFNDPGTGKTLSALWAADYLMTLGLVRRCLIVCPLSIMHSAWLAEMGRSIIHRSGAIAHNADASRRVKTIEQGYEFIVLNYDGLPLVADTIKKDGTFDLVIVDEANAYKNITTRRWKTLNSILTPNTYLWMMTGTPAAQSPEDAYGLAKLVNPSGVPQFFTGWRDKVMNKLSMFRWAPKPDANDKVFAALQPAIRYTKEECLDLPPVLTTERDIPLTPQQEKYYAQLKNRMLIEAAGETISAVNAAAEMNKLLQISAGAAYTDGGEVVEFDCNPRLNVLMEVLQETKRKVLVFAPYRHSIDTIGAFLDKQGIRHEKIHGDVSANNRTRIFAEFQDAPDIRILVIQPMSASHGVTLTAADTVVFWGPVLSVETYVQCVARLDRQGQTSNQVTVVHLQSSPVEKKMFKRLAERVLDHSAMVALYQEEVAQTT